MLPACCCSSQGTPKPCSSSSSSSCSSQGTPKPPPSRPPPVLPTPARALTPALPTPSPPMPMEPAALGGRHVDAQRPVEDGAVCASDGSERAVAAAPSRAGELAPVNCMQRQTGGARARFLGRVVGSVHNLCHAMQHSAQHSVQHACHTAQHVAQHARDAVQHSCHEAQRTAAGCLRSIPPMLHTTSASSSSFSSEAKATGKVLTSKAVHVGWEGGGGLRLGAPMLQSCENVP